MASRSGRRLKVASTITDTPPCKAARAACSRRANAGVVGDGQRIVLRDVEVGADEHAFAAQIEIGKAFEFHRSRPLG
jgi:hypothetical protein